MSTSKTPTARTLEASHKKLAIFYMSAAVALQASMSAMVKFLSYDYPTAQLVFCRNFFAVLPLIFLLRSGGWKQLQVSNLSGHFARAVLGLAATTFYFLSLEMLPLAEASVLGFASPLFTALLSWPLIRERVSGAAWAAILVGFAGVVVSSQVGKINLSAGAIIALTGALFLALSRIATRHLSLTNTAVAITFWYSVNSAVLSGFALLAEFHFPDLADAAVLIGIGIAGGLSQLCLTQAHKLYSAAAVAPIDYTGLLWAALFGYAIWGEVPTLHVIVGGVLVIVGGLFLLRVGNVSKRNAAALHTRKTPTVREDVE